MIDTTAYPKIGNMTKGSGLAGIFDATHTTTGYAEAGKGWAGVDMRASPKKVSHVRLTSATNGFDASGSSSPYIRIHLRGKNGSAPVPFTNDGILLGYTWFADKNTTRRRSIHSNAKNTTFDYIWIEMETPVWCVLANFEIFEHAPVAPIACTDNAVPHFSRCDDTVPLPWNGMMVPQFQIDFASIGNAFATVDFQCNFEHVGPESPASSFIGVIGVGAYVMHKHATTFAALDTTPWQEVGVSGCNIDDRSPKHYESISIVALKRDIAEGFHRFGVYASAHTMLSSQDGLAAILAEGDNDPRGLNGLRIIEMRKS